MLLCYFLTVRGVGNLGPLYGFRYPLRGLTNQFFSPPVFFWVLSAAVGLEPTTFPSQGYRRLAYLCTGSSVPTYLAFGRIRLVVGSPGIGDLRGLSPADAKVHSERSQATHKAFKSSSNTGLTVHDYRARNCPSLP